ncbi:MAG: hypothetical protein F2789_10480, partial [Actinobacteria bacterium]|nr:hypothetical protein [Actinomycetota bacterium]
MQAASAGDDSGAKKSVALKRYGPIIGLLAAVGIGVGVLVVSGGDDNNTAGTTPGATSPTTPGSESSTPVTGGTAGAPAPADLTYPYSFTQAKAQGVTVEWGARCDTKTGKLAVPDFFAPDCYAP